MVTLLNLQTLQILWMDLILLLIRKEPLKQVIYEVLLSGSEGLSSNNAHAELFCSGGAGETTDSITVVTAPRKRKYNHRPVASTGSSCKCCGGFEGIK
jgi:hypothetical protein